MLLWICRKTGGFEKVEVLDDEPAETRTKTDNPTGRKLVMIPKVPF
jgi:hypothetical protein